MPALSIVFNSREDQYVDLTKDCYVVGREPDCDIVIDNLGISRRHFRLVKAGSTYQVEDLNSSNGTYLNGKRLEGPMFLNGDDEIAIGKHILVFKNEAAADQPSTDVGAAASKPAGGGVAGMTMEMDGDVIRKRMEQMRLAREKGAGPAAGPGAPAGPASDAPHGAGWAQEAAAQGLQRKYDALRKQVGLMIALFGGAIAILLVVVVVLALKLAKIL